MDRYRSAAGFVIFLAMCLGAGFVGSLLTLPSIRSGWYGALKKPFFNPPAWVFGTVWTALFIMMALAAWLVWKKEDLQPVRIPLLFFFAQLLCNVLWSALFFGSMRPGWALVEIAVLWFLILVTAGMFFRVRPAAGFLMLPYLGWVSFAVLLNGFIWWMNRGGVRPIPGLEV
jgi:tryptophan-rich sensory protein